MGLIGLEEKGQEQSRPHLFSEGLYLVDFSQERGLNSWSFGSMGFSVVGSSV